MNAVRAFEAAARHKSVTQAATELCVTPTAISHQIRLLEEFLQFKLFTRRSSKLELTPATVTSVGKITAALDLIDSALKELSEPDNQRERFMLGASSSFTSLWLMPRLQTFLKESNDMDITVKSYHSRAEIEVESTDLQICEWETTLDRLIEPFMEEEIIPVCSPTLAAHYGSDPAQLFRYAPLIHFEQQAPAINEFPDWVQYLRKYGINRDDVNQGTRFNHNVAAIDAVKAGFGAYLGRSLLVEGALERGELVQIGAPFPVRNRYYLVSHWKPRAPHAVTRFKDWLYRQVQGSARVQVL
ncbi:LysR substrate-binding domain-containing protein [Verticiella sediminum]|uniref:LysR substrate-binding domain-containing protein n=1 Tax=Verticiella sediminum TaxID=1247510 RepID=UPI0014793E67|nr:LysR substrate-binding domain-containing protein [Verticiella sediminum]